MATKNIPNAQKNKSVTQKSATIAAITGSTVGALILELFEPIKIKEINKALKRFDNVYWNMKKRLTEFDDAGLDAACELYSLVSIIDGNGDDELYTDICTQFTHKYTSLLNNAQKRLDAYRNIVFSKTSAKDISRLTDDCLDYMMRVYKKCKLIIKQSQENAKQLQVEPTEMVDEIPEEPSDQ